MSDIRKQVVINVRQDGEGALEKLSLEAQSLTQRITGLWNAIATGNATVAETTGELKSLLGQLGFVEKQLSGVREELARSDPEWQRYQDRLRAMAQESVDRAGEQAEANRRAVTQGLNAVKQTIEGIEEREEAERRAAIEAEKAAQAQLAAADATRRASQIANDAVNRELDAITRADARKRELLDAEVQAERDAAQARDEFLARVEAAEEMRRQRRQRNADANFNEGTAALEYQREAEALQEIASASSRAYEKLDAIATATAKAVKEGDVALANRLAAQYEHLKSSVATASGAFREITPQAENLNRVINAGAAYTTQASPSWQRYNMQVWAAAEAQRRFGNSAEEIARKGERSAYAILHIAHATQDLQYGVGAVLNNIPLLVQAFGGGPGLAGGIMIAAVAADTAYNNLEKIKNFVFKNETVNLFATDVEVINKRVEELEKRWLKLPEVIRAAKQAARDAEDAREAEKHKDATDAVQAGNKQAFDAAIKAAPGGGNAMTNAVHEVEMSKFLDNPVQAIANAARMGRFGPNVSERDVVKDMKSSDEMYKFWQERFVNDVMPLVRNERISRLSKGEKDETNLFLAEAGQHRRLGERGEDGQFKNPFLKAFAANLPHEKENRKWAEDAEKEIEAAEKEWDDFAKKMHADGQRHARILSQMDEAEAKANLNAQIKSGRDWDSEVSHQASSLGGNLDDVLLKNAIGMKATNKDDDAIRTTLASQVFKQIQSAGIGGNIADPGMKEEFLTQITNAIMKKFMTDFAGKLSARAMTLPNAEEAGIAPLDENHKPKGRRARLAFEAEQARRAAARRKSPEQRAAEALQEEIEAKEHKHEDADASHNARHDKQAGLANASNFLQGNFGLSPQQANAAAPGMISAMDKGLSPVAAGQQVVRQLMQYVDQQQMAMLHMQANQEKMLGIFGPALQRFSMIQAQNAMVSQQMNRMAQGAQGGILPMFPAN